MRFTRADGMRPYPSHNPFIRFYNPLANHLAMGVDGASRGRMPSAPTP